jgi:hypothetical protein
MKIWIAAREKSKTFKLFTKNMKIATRCKMKYSKKRRLFIQISKMRIID